MKKKFIFKDDGSGDRQNLHLRSSIFWPKGRLICIFKLVLEYRSGLCSTQVDLVVVRQLVIDLLLIYRIS